MNKNKILVVKRNELIEGRYKLSALAQKVLASLISKVDPKCEKLPEFVLSPLEFTDLTGISKTGFYNEIDSITSELGRILLTLEDDESITKINLFLKSRYVKTKKETIFIFHPDVEPYIRDFVGNFTQYQYEQIKSLMSRYSIRLYELFRRYHPIRCSREISYWQIEVDELKEKIGAYEIKNAEKPDKITLKYASRYNNFRCKVLAPSQIELREKTDICFDFKPVRRGRKIYAIKFIIRHNQKFKPPFEQRVELIAKDVPELDSSLAAMIRSKIPGITDTVIQTLALYSKSVLMDSLLAYVGVSEETTIEKPVDYFLGIVSKIEKEQAASKPKTTEQKLTDRSWSDGLLDE